MTVLQILNRVLSRLREDSVTELEETEYSTLITGFLQDIHEELLENEWSSMWHTINVPLTASTRVYDLSRTIGDGGNIANTDRVATTNSVPKWGKWFASDTDIQGYDLDLRGFSETEARYQQYRGYTSNIPECLALRNNPDRDGLELIMFPTPSEDAHLRLGLWTPETSIDSVADKNRELLVPSRPLILGALYLALNERGEEIGEPGGIAERRYMDSVGIALESDINRRQAAGEFRMERA